MVNELVMRKAHCQEEINKILHLENLTELMRTLNSKISISTVRSWREASMMDKIIRKKLQDVSRPMVHSGSMLQKGAINLLINTER